MDASDFQLFLNAIIDTKIHDQGEESLSPPFPFSFSSFIRRSPAVEGIRFGLNSTQKILPDHGGHLSFKSHPGLLYADTIDVPVARNSEKGEV